MSTKQSSGTTSVFDPTALVTNLAGLRGNMALPDPVRTFIIAFLRPNQEAG